MDIEQLRTVLALNRTRHFRLTGEELFITQSAVSARIRKLEEELGVVLFDRRTRDVQPTPEGFRLLRHAEAMIAIYRRALQDVALAEEAKVQLAVGGTESLWDVLLQEWVHDLYRNTPRLALLAEAQAHDVLLLRRLLDGALDLIFLYEPPQLEEVIPVEIAAVPLIMVASAADLTVEQALSDGYIMVDWGHSFALQHAREFPDAPPPMQRMNRSRMALAFIQACGGSAYLAEQTVIDALDQGALYRVNDAPVITRYAHAAYARRSIRSDLIRQVLGYF